jgi:hypothetical protein
MILVKTHFSKSLGYIFKLLCTSHSIGNVIGRTYVFNQEINKLALPTTITRSREIVVLM